MIDYDLIRKTLYTTIVDATGNRVIWTNPNAPRPIRPYITLNILNTTSVGRDYLTPPNNNGDAAIIGNREMILEVNYYGSDGITEMEKIRTCFFDPNVTDALNKVGLAFIERMTFLNTTELMDSMYEYRYTMELRFRYSNQGEGTLSTINIGVIETVDIARDES